MVSFSNVLALILAICLRLYPTKGYNVWPRPRTKMTVDSCVLEPEQDNVYWGSHIEKKEEFGEMQPIIQNHMPPLSDEYINGECKLVESTNMTYVVCNTEANNSIHFNIEGNIDKMYMDTVISTMNNNECFTDISSNFKTFIGENPEFIILLMMFSTYAKILKMKNEHIKRYIQSIY